MLEAIIKALRSRSDLKAWNVRHVNAKEIQQYELRTSTEAKRMVESDRYLVDVLRENSGTNDQPNCGTGSVTLLPGDDIDRSLDEAALMAGLVNNEPYDFPEPAQIPEVALADVQFQSDPLGTIDDILSQLKQISSNYSDIRLTAAECFGEERTTHLVNSKNVDASQVSTIFHLEWVFIAGEGDEEVESFAEIKRRRVEDFDLEAEVERRVRYTADLITAGEPPSYQGAIVLRGKALATAMTSMLVEMRSSAEHKYKGETPWDIGQSIFTKEVEGDSLTLWANRQLPYGVNSNRFDSEGIPAQRIELIRDNELIAFTATKRFADYLNIPATGSFGNIEIASGTNSTESLLETPHIEISEFSWFNPSPITGEFACEIRLGYVVEDGRRIPFRGGMLVGNLLDALANVRWSSEIGFYGNYYGPTTARFNELTVAGKGQL